MREVVGQIVVGCCGDVVIVCVAVFEAENLGRGVAALGRVPVTPGADMGAFGKYALELHSREAGGAREGEQAGDVGAAPVV